MFWPPRSSTRSTTCRPKTESGKSRAQRISVQCADASFFSPDGQSWNIQKSSARRLFNTLQSRTVPSYVLAGKDRAEDMLACRTQSFWLDHCYCAARAKTRDTQTTWANGFVRRRECRTDTVALVLPSSMSPRSRRKETALDSSVQRNTCSARGTKTPPHASRQHAHDTTRGTREIIAARNDGGRTALSTGEEGARRRQRMLASVAGDAAVVRHDCATAVLMPVT